MPASAVAICDGHCPYTHRSCTLPAAIIRSLRMKKLAVLILVLSVSTVAQAGKSGAFFGGGYSFANIKADGLAEFDMSALDIAGGLMFNEFLGFDARLGLGVSQDTKELNVGILTTEAETSLTSYYGLYLRPQYMQDRMQIYGLLGYAGADIELNVKNTRLDFEGSDAGVSYGAGIGFSPDRTLFFNVEYLKMLSGDDYDFNGINLRIEFKL